MEDFRIQEQKTNGLPVVLLRRKETSRRVAFAERQLLDTPGQESEQSQRARLQLSHQSRQFFSSEVAKAIAPVAGRLSCRRDHESCQQCLR